MSGMQKDLMALLQKAWEKEPELDLLHLIEHLALAAGHLGSISNFKDKELLEQLQKNQSCCRATLPGVHCEYVPDFRTAILKARGCEVLTRSL